MPMYEYACEECQTEFETLVRSESHEKEVTCPKCESPKVAKQLSIPGRPKVVAGGNPCGEGPPCGASWCKRQG